MENQLSAVIYDKNPTSKIKVTRIDFWINYTPNCF